MNDLRLHSTNLQQGPGSLQLLLDILLSNVSFENLLYCRRTLNNKYKTKQKKEFLSALIHTKMLESLFFMMFGPLDVSSYFPNITHSVTVLFGY